MALETIIPCFADLIKEPFKNYVLSPIARHIGYAFRCDRNVETLQNQVEQLKIKTLERQLLVNNATNNDEEILPSVAEWLTAAGKEIDDAENLIQAKSEAMNKCSIRLCPNLKTRYQLSKKAHKKALAVGEKLEDAPDLSGPISCPRPPQQIVEPSVYSSEALPSRVLILNQIMDALKDPTLKMIGVYGMGGVGKTRLAKEVKGKAMQEKMLFDTVVMVAVSHTPDLRRLQGEIADSLGLKLGAEGVPGRAGQLHQRLEKAKVLIILDDVWQKLDLNAVGVPCGDAYDGCKIFLTSRRKDVLCNEMGTQKEFPLEVLREEETWRLFEMSLSNIIDPELHGIAEEIAKKCGGLPLLILKVAADLRGKQSYAWNDMLNRLSSLENTEIYEIVHGVIESSFEKLLDEEAKSVFLLCALFKDSNIEIQKLVMYSVGLDLFKGIYTIEGARNRVLTLIDELKDECLLLDGDRAGFVKIHDVVHDIALVIASRVQHVFVGSLKVRAADFQNNDCTRISLSHCVISELPSVLECPKAEVLSLSAQSCGFWSYYRGPPFPSSFFKGASKLKVVDFTEVHIASGLPRSLGSLRDLKTLCLQGCRLDHNVAVVAELKQLEVLTFADSDIEEFPEEIKGLTRLKLLDFTRCYSLERIPANVLSNLSSLEELYVLVSFSGWDTAGNASLGELKNLSYLRTLEIQIEDDKLLPKDWFFDGVQNYRISIGDWYWCSNEYETSRRILKLELKTSTGLVHRIKEFVRGTEVLELRDVKGVENILYDCGKLGILIIIDCDTFTILFSPSTIKNLRQLKELVVRSCGKMEAIVGGGSEKEEEIEFTQLRSLSLYYLPNIITFCRSCGTVGYPKLTRLEVSGCKSLKYVFTTSMVKSLKQLRVLEISYCESMEEILLSEKIEEEENIDRIVFPQLYSLELVSLQKLRRFSSGHPIDFPSLKMLKIANLREMENLVSMLNNNESDELVSFSHLTKLEVSKCMSLKYVFTTSTVKCLEQLRELTIRDCKSMEVIILSEKIEESIDRIVMPVLVTLRLQNLRNLKRFSVGHSIDFPSLAVLETSKCRKIKNLVSKLPNKSNNNDSDDNHGSLFDELVAFSNLKELHIAEMDKLRHIWSEDIVVLQNLQSIRVSKCPNVNYLFPATVTACSLPQLRKLEIQECCAEVTVQMATDESFEWPNLTNLEVDGCKGLKYVFTNSMVKSLMKLQKLEIKGCKSMEEIILSEETEQANVSRIEFRELDHLRLTNLPDLKRFSTGHPVDFPSLRELKIVGCSAVENLVSKFMTRSNDNESVDKYLFNEMVTFSKLEILHIEGMNKLRHIWSEDITIPNLQWIKISNCPDLKYVFPALVACGLSQLERLEIEKCGIKGIILMAEDKTVRMEWPKLWSLKVRDCTKLLKCGYSYVKLFPNVKHFNLDCNCAKAIESAGTQVLCTSGKHCRYRIQSY